MKKITLYTAMVLFIVGMNFISSNAQTADSYFKAAEKKYASRNFEEAVKEYTKAIALDSTKINYYLRRGFCYNVLEDYQAAISDYTKVIQIDRNNKFALLSRGSAKNKIENYKEAIKDFDAVLAIDSKDCEAYNNRGFAKKALGDKDGACDDWNKSKKMGNEEARIIIENNKCK